MNKINALCQINILFLIFLISRIINIASAAYATWSNHVRLRGTSIRLTSVCLTKAVSVLWINTESCLSLYLYSTTESRT